MKTITQLSAMSADDRAAVVAKHARTAERLEDGGRKETAKAIVAIEAADDMAGKSVRSYLKGKGIAVEKIKGVYEIARVARAVADKKIDLSEAEFDAAASSKLQILSRFFKDENQPQLPAAVALVKKDAPAKEIRALLAKQDKDEPVLVIDDIGANDPILLSATLRGRITADANAILNHEMDTEAAEEVFERVAKIFTAMAYALEKDTAIVIGDIMATLEGANAAEGAAAA